MQIPFAIFVRYTRIFYNTPWNEKYAIELNSEGQATLMNKDLFSALGRWVKARNAQDPQRLVEVHLDIRKNIESTYENLLKKLQGLESENAFIGKRLREPGDRATLLNEVRAKQQLREKIEIYLSSAFGRFQPERFGQEVSYLWLDLATVSGVRDLLGVFLREYNKYTPVSSMFFANL